MPIPYDHLEPTAAVSVILTALFGPTLSSVLGPYAVIIISALVGGGWALSRRESTTRVSAVGFLFLITATATLVTAMLALMANRWIHLDSVTWLLAPIGLLIGAVGHDWPEVGKWLLQRLGRRIERDTNSGEDPK